MFIITGCQRSGTTLLGMALDAHARLTVIEEDNSQFHESIGETLLLKFQACRDYHPAGFNNIGFKAPRDSHRLEDFTRAYPVLKTLWLRRPAVQTVASMVSLIPKPSGPSWAMGWAPREIRKHITQFKDSELAQDLERAEAIINTRQREVAYAALCWRAKETQRLIYSRISKLSILDIDYEALVRRPKPTLEPVIHYLDIAWDDNILRHAQVLKAELRPGLSDTRRPIDTQSLDKWQALFRAEEQKIIAEYSRLSLMI